MSLPLAEQCCSPLSAPSLAEGHLGWSQVWVMMTVASVNIRLQVSCVRMSLVSPGECPGVGLLGHMTCAHLTHVAGVAVPSPSLHMPGRPAAPGPRLSRVSNVVIPQVGPAPLTLLFSDD